MKPSKFLKSAYKGTDYPSFKAFIREMIRNDHPDAIQWRKNKGYSEDWVNATSRPKA